jgi:hypothetical protein
MVLRTVATIGPMHGWGIARSSSTRGDVPSFRSGIARTATLEKFWMPMPTDSAMAYGIVASGLKATALNATPRRIPCLDDAFLSVDHESDTYHTEELAGGYDEYWNNEGETVKMSPPGLPSGAGRGQLAAGPSSGTGTPDPSTAT